MRDETTLSIAAGDGFVTAITSEPEEAGRATFIYTPGAGSNVDDPFGKQLCRVLAAITVPTLFCFGTRDVFASPDEHD